MPSRRRFAKRGVGPVLPGADLQQLAVLFMPAFSGYLPGVLS